MNVLLECLIVACVFAMPCRAAVRGDNGTPRLFPASPLGNHLIIPPHYSISLHFEALITPPSNIVCFLHNCVHLYVL